MKRYKLTDQNIQTHDGFQWTVGVWETIKDHDPKADLCSRNWFHCYNHPLLAAFFNPICGSTDNPRLWLVETRGRSKKDGCYKRGYPQMRLVKELVLPEITTEQRVEIAIRCALCVYHEPSFVKWAEDWLSGKERRTEAEAWDQEEHEAEAAAAWAEEEAARLAAKRAEAAAAWAEEEAARLAAKRAEAAWAGARAAEAAARAAAWAEEEAARLAAKRTAAAEARAARAARAEEEAGRLAVWAEEKARVKAAWAAAAAARAAAAAARAAAWAKAADADILTIIQGVLSKDAE